MTDHIDIEPLQPPFKTDVVTVEFKGESQRLAVSPADYARICDLLGTDITDRVVELSPCADNHHIRIKVMAS